MMESSTCDVSCEQQEVQVEFDLREKAAIFISEAKSKLITFSSVGLQSVVTACLFLFEAIVADDCYIIVHSDVSELLLKVA